MKRMSVGIARDSIILPNTKVVAKRNPPKKSASIRIMNDKPLGAIKEASRA